MIITICAKILMELDEAMVARLEAERKWVPWPTTLSFSLVGSRSPQGLTLLQVVLPRDCLLASR